MIGAGKTFALWGLYLAILWGVTWAFGVPDAETLGLLAAASVACACMGAWTWWRGRRGVAPHGDESGARRDPDLSLATTWTAIALSLLLLSAAYGPWLAFIAGGLLIVGVGGLVREFRAAREADAPNPGGSAVEEVP